MLSQACFRASRFLISRSYSAGHSTGHLSVYLRNSVNRAELFLVGIDHISPRSVELVRNLIRDVRPNAVAVELCEERSRKLLSATSWARKVTFWDFFNFPGGLKEKGLMYFISRMYASFAAAGFKPGNEFRVAIEEGRAAGAQVFFIDQEVNVTLKRAAQAFSLRSIFNFIVSKDTIREEYPNFVRAITHEDIEKCAEALVTKSVIKEGLEMSEKYFPEMVKALLSERNEVMVKQLREMNGLIVGVVGALHVPGIQKLWLEADLQCPRSLYRLWSPQ